MALTSLIASVSVSLNCVLFPVKWAEMISVLEKLGFNINEALPYPLPTGRVSGSGKVARKGRTTFSVNPGDKSIVMTDRTIQDAKTELNDFITTLKTDHGLDILKYIQFYQFTSSHKYSIKKEAYQSLSKSCNIPKSSKFSEILGFKVEPYSIRLGQSGTIPNSENWFDVLIDPDFERNDGFNVNTVYRNQDFTIYNAFISNYEEKIIKLMSLIEG